MNYFLAQVAVVLLTPIALCVLTMRIKRDGVGGSLRRIAVVLNAAADVADIAQSEFRERKRQYSVNAGLSVEAGR